MGEWTRADAIGSEAAAALPFAKARGFQLSPQHHSLNVRGGLLQLAMGAYILINLAAIAITFVAASFIDRAYEGLFESEEAFESEALFIESASNGIFWTSIAVMVLCAVAYSIFVYGAAKNIQRSNAKGMTDSPGWAVGWSFVPFANLFKPYKVMGDIWVSSHDPVRAALSAPAFMLLWWLPYIAGNVISNITDRMMTATEDPQQIISLAWIEVAASVMSIVAGLVLVFIVRKIVTAQAAWASIPPPPPPAPHDPNAPLF